ncbi:MAG: ATP-binding protein [Bacillota bacterium]
MRPLRTKLIIAFVSVILLTGVALSGLATFAVRRSFWGFLERYREVRVVAWVDALEGWYLRERSWVGLQRWLELLSRKGGVRRGGTLAGEDRVLVADDRKVVVADSDGELVGRPLSSGLEAAARPINVAGRTVGYVVVTPAPGSPLAILESTFTASVRRVIILGGLLSSAAGILLGVYLANDITRPIVAVQRGAERLAGGDLSHRVQVNTGDEIEELAEAFNSMAESLQRDEAVRRNLTADIAHELRTPLTVLRGNLEALQDGVTPLSPEVIGLLYDEVLRMSRLVSDLSELSLAEARQLRLERRLTDLDPLVEAVTQAFRAEALNGGVELVIASAPGLPPVSIDQDRIAQVVANLVRNALQHTGAGGRVEVATVASDSGLEVTVRDTGQGISPDDLPRVFDRFYRADKSRARVGGGGTGLGLAVAKGLVEAHGGRIWVESQPGQGSTFGFWIPFPNAI